MKVTIKEYLNIIRQYSRHILNDHKNQGELKISLTVIINFISSKDSDAICTIHAKSNNMEFMMGNGTDEIIKELFESLLQKYQEGLEGKKRGSEFLYDSVDLLHYNLHKISLNRGGSYMDSPKWLKIKKKTVNPENNDDK